MLWGAFFLLMLFWGCSFLAIHVVLESIPPFAAAGLRLFFAATIILLYSRARGARWPSLRKHRWQWAGIGLVNFGISWAALFWGEQYVMPAVASIINSTVPLMVTVISWKLLKSERATPVELLGVLLGFAGILFVFAPSVQSFYLDRMGLYGMLAVLAMSVAYGFGTVMIRRMGAAADMCWSFILQAYPAAFMLLAMSALFESKGWLEHPFSSVRPWIGIAYLAVFSSAIAWILYFRLLHAWGALRASSITYAMPVVSILVDWLYLHRLPTRYQFFGAALILQAIYLMRLAKVRASRSADAEKPRASLRAG